MLNKGDFNSNALLDGKKWGIDLGKTLWPGIPPGRGNQSEGGAGAKKRFGFRTNSGSCNSPRDETEKEDGCERWLVTAVVRRDGSTRSGRELACGDMQAIPRERNHTFLTEKESVLQGPLIADLKKRG